MEGLSDRQLQRFRKEFRKGLASGLGLDGAKRDLQGLVEDLLCVDPDEAEALADRIADEVMAGAARIRTVDWSTIRKPCEQRRQWYCGSEEGDRLWPSLRDRLLNEKNWSRASVESIDEYSNTIVGCLSPPGLDSSSVRGLVVGHVQSGKTANMTAVIAKAVDRGYRLILVFAGMTDSLRTQTQRRLEADLVQGNQDFWELLTVDEQDFQAGSRPWLSMPGQAAFLAVIKKDTNILRRFRELLDNTPAGTRAQIPALIIDDETDQASPDVSRPSQGSDPSTINLRIREILERFSRFSYVGYTATPFANVLSDPADSGQEGRLARGLYPDDFIVSLPTPPDYFGPESLFGRDMTSAEEAPPEESGLDMVRNISGDELQRIREIERCETGANEPLPHSLEDAVLWFIVSAAILQERRQSHCTMLVHTSARVDAHDSIADALKSFVHDLKSGRLDGNRQRMALLLDTESKRVEPDRFDHEPRSIDSIWSRVEEVARSVRVLEDNYVSDDRVEFPDEGPPAWTIVVGGNRLARGVTLPGLLVSYFGRNTRQYDTLLQMGRWFGYRHGYEDLPRIWMTAETAANFRELATIEAEIREDISVYAQSKITPLDWAVRIRQVPGMLVTRRAAMKHARTAALSYGGEHVQTIRFYHKNREWLASNWNAAERLIESAADQGAKHEARPGGHVFHDLPVTIILEFLANYRTSSEQRRTNTSAIRKYIDEYMDKGLDRWNVGVIGPASGQKSELPLGPLGKVRTVIRAKMKDSPDDAVDIKALMSKRDVLVDLPDQKKVSDTPSQGTSWKAFKKYREEVQSRNHRPLLLLYPIRRDSPPRVSGRDRVQLDAVMDVMGLGLVFPEGRTGDYVSVDLRALAIDAEVEED
ncbi:Z1 domain-containing protein [Natronospira bacteriovora]|uniref:Z1 domain-containing protein n=1 Tax=Natronospira bacteriovora TaxID=3069753 RepID=A0ABU0W5C5_9GAMM|nr:Z1 domain-containing protein [Natronospira sp. AB-CW4]MDQ2068650.1 Z1 domain-containing protein [Natronospira sp. AB-CW4]